MKEVSRLQNLRTSPQHAETTEAARIRRISRRGLLAAAASGFALTGCARPVGLLSRLGIPVPLHIHILGVPSDQAANLIAALGACQKSYAQASRGDVTLRVTTALVPENTWYDCVPPPKPPLNTCPPDSYPASPAKLPSEPFVLAGDTSSAGQLGVNGVPQLLIRGRTALEVKFGGGSLSVPVINHTYQGWPDVILAFDMWQYWLAPLAADLAAPWKTVTDDRNGLPQNFARFGRYYAANRGTFLAAFPILRNPMTIYNFDPIAPWDWPQVISTIKRPSGGPHPFITTWFVPSDLYPQATELAASVVAAFGGQLGRSGVDATVPAFVTSAARQGFAGLADIVNAGPTVVPGGYPVGPTYIWNPFGGARQGFGLTSGVLPLPPGPARRAAPCMYFCATIVSLGRQVSAATDFASFLMNPSSQEALSQWTGALPLRTTQAEPIIHERWPHLSDALTAMLATTDGDLRAADLFGGEKTTGNASSYDGVADRFAGALSAILGQKTSPAGISAVLEHWATS